MHVGGKLGGRAVVAATVHLGRPGRLAVLRDTSSKVIYLVDTGAVYSVIPHISTSTPTGPAITAADRTPIPCWGWKIVIVSAGGRVFRWRFLLAAVAFALIGSDFLSHFDLMVDLRRLRLVGDDRKIFQLQEPPLSGVFALHGVHAAQAAAMPVASSAPPCSPTSALPCSPPSALPCSTLSALPCSSSSVPAASKGLRWRRRWWLRTALRRPKLSFRPLKNRGGEKIL
jgi:hypothetical protein